MKRLIALSVLLLPALAAAQQAAPSEPKLVWGDDCSFKCNGHADCKAPSAKIGQHFCDYQLGLGPEHQKFFNQSMNYKQQQEYLKVEVPNADELFSNYQRDTQEILSATDPKGLPAANEGSSKYQQRKALKARQDAIASYKERINTDGMKACSNFIAGAKLRHREGQYLAPFSGRLRELDAAATGATTDLTKKEEAIKKDDEAMRQKMQAKMAQSPDNRTQTGRLKGSAQKLEKADTKDKAALSQQMFEGNTRKGGRLGGAGGQNASQLEGAALAGGTMRGNFTSYKGMQDSSVRDLEKPKAEGAAGVEKKKEGEGKGWYAKQWLGKKEEQLEDAGTARMIAANQHDDAAQKALRDADNACKTGGTWDCMKAKASGYAGYVGHKAADYGNTAAAFGIASTEGLTRAAQNKGPEAQIVKYGATGVAMLTPVGIGGALVTYGVTSGAQKVGGAENGKEAAIGGFEMVAAAAAPAAGRAATRAVEGVADAVPMVERGLAWGGKMVSSAASYVMPKAATVVEAATFGAVSRATIVEAAEITTEEGAGKLVTEKVADYTIVKPAEHSGKAAIEHF